MYQDIIFQPYVGKFSFLIALNNRQEMVIIMFHPLMKYLSILLPIDSELVEIFSMETFLFSSLCLPFHKSKKHS